MKAAIRSLKPSKSPGIDGLTVEFYKICQEQLARELQKIFALCLDGRKMPHSWSETRIIVIPKQVKGLSVPQEYRLIFLLNMDYKILARRMTAVINPYIHQDQAGFLGSRYMKD